MVESEFFADSEAPPEGLAEGEACEGDEVSDGVTVMLARPLSVGEREPVAVSVAVPPIEDVSDARAVSEGAVEPVTLCVGASEGLLAGDALVLGDAEGDFETEEDAVLVGERLGDALLEPQGVAVTD